MQSLGLGSAMLMAATLLIASCRSPEPPTAQPTPTESAPLPARSPKPSPTVSDSPYPGATLSVRFPLESSRFLGGYPLRVLLYLVDAEARGVEGAEAQVYLLSPGGDLFAMLPCEDLGQGRYMTSYVQLPIRGAAGEWLVWGKARLENGETLQAASSFEGRPSFSEELEGAYGFWLDVSSPLFDYVGPRVVVPVDKYHPYPEGGGVVILANTLTSEPSEVFVILDVHWHPAEFPADSSAAASYVQEIMGPHAKSVAITRLAVQQISYQDRPAWHVTGLWAESDIGGQIRLGPSHHPIEWLIFECPESDWLWILVISAYRESDMPDLRSILGTFECPVSE